MVPSSKFRQELYTKRGMLYSMCCIPKKKRFKIQWTVTDINVNIIGLLGKCHCYVTFRETRFLFDLYFLLFIRKYFDPASYWTQMRASLYKKVLPHLPCELV